MNWQELIEYSKKEKSKTDAEKFAEQYRTNDVSSDEPEEVTDKKKNTNQNNNIMNKYVKIGLIVAGVAVVGYFGYKFLKPKKAE